MRVYDRYEAQELFEQGYTLRGVNSELLYKMVDDELYTVRHGGELTSVARLGGNFTIAEIPRKPPNMRSTNNQEAIHGAVDTQMENFHWLARAAIWAVNNASPEELAKFNPSPKYTEQDISIQSSDRQLLADYKNKIVRGESITEAEKTALLADLIG